MEKTTDCNNIVDEVVGRIRLLAGIPEGNTNDSALARAIGVDPRKFHVWLSRKAIPNRAITTICKKNGWSLDYVLSGRTGSLLRGQNIDSSSAGEVAISEWERRASHWAEMYAQCERDKLAIQQQFLDLQKRVNELEAELATLRQPAQPAKTGVATAYLRSPAVPGR